MAEGPVTESSSTPSTLRRLSQVGRHGVAPALVLLAPFVSFLKFQGYAYYRPEVLVCAAGIAAISLALGVVASTGGLGRGLVLAGVLTFFIDVRIPGAFWFHGVGRSGLLAGAFAILTALLWLLRQHAERVITIVAATVLVSTAVMPSGPSVAEGAPAAAARHDLPLIVHVILDEHIGIDGLPPDRTVPGLQADLRSFYQSLGFRTFDAAYSQFQDTELSIGHLLNLSTGDYHPDLLRSDAPGFHYSLTRSVYFSRMIEEGYRIHAYQTEWLQFCPDTGRAVCETYSASGIAVLQNLPLRISEKARVITGTFLSQSSLYGKAIDRYDALRLQVARFGIHLPRGIWFWKMAPLNGMTEMKRVATELSGATRGELYFAHFMLPHWPQVYDADCTLIPFDRWTGEGPALVSRREQTEAYVHYDRQVRCTSRMIRELIESIPANLQADAILIVQGDHGSRLSLAHAASPTDETTAADNDRNTYSTLFAVRSPGLGSASDHRLVPVTCILESLVNGGFRSLPGLDTCAPVPSVFRRGARGVIVKAPLALVRNRPN